MEGGAHEFDGSTFKECFSLSWRNPYVLRLAFSAGIGGLLFGYDTGTISGIIAMYNWRCVGPQGDVAERQTHFRLAAGRRVLHRQRVRA